MHSGNESKARFRLVQSSGPYSAALAAADTLDEIVSFIDPNYYFSVLNIECSEASGDVSLYTCRRYRDRPWVGVRREWDTFGPLPDGETCATGCRIVERDGRTELIFVWGTDKGGVESKVMELESACFGHEVIGDGNDTSLRRN